MLILVEVTGKHQRLDVLDLGDLSVHLSIRGGHNNDPFIPSRKIYFTLYGLQFKLVGPKLCPACHRSGSRPRVVQQTSSADVMQRVAAKVKVHVRINTTYIF